MKWFIASDLHGSAFYCEQMLTAFQQERADRILLLGDILYHGPRNALPEGYDTGATAEMLNRFAHRILCVRGNCDAEVDQWVLDFPILSDYSLLDTDSCRICATHGHSYGPDNLPPRAGCDVLLSGHTHIPGFRQQEGFVSMNPGSVAIPKENSPHSFMTLEAGVFRWKDLEGNEFLRFPAAK